MSSRFKETGYGTTKQDAVTSYRPDIKYKRFGDVGNLINRTKCQTALKYSLQDRGAL